MRHLGQVHHEMGYRFEEEGWLIPDVSITHSDQKGDDYYLASPALAIEVISNEKTADYLADKIEHSSRAALLEVWVAYPCRKHQWVYTRDGKYMVHSGANLTDPFGHPWSLATHIEDFAPAEMKKRTEAYMAKLAETQRTRTA